MEALRRFYPPGKSTWEGTVEEGMMPGDPDSPEMRAVGEGRVEWVIDDMWIVCDFRQDQYVGDAETPAVTWQSHFVAGWDLARQAYQAFAVDSNGASLAFTGSIQGNELVWDATSDSILGDSTAVRMVQDASDPERMPWRTEKSTKGGAWELVEEYVVEPETPVEERGQ